MNVILIPFFLAARVAVDRTWEHGPEFVFQVQVNSTAIPLEGFHGSVRLNLTSKLICQPKDFDSLSCHFEDSKAVSFMAESLDPADPGVPISEVNRQQAYEMNRDQFEIRFDERGLAGLTVNENIQPRELDMIRVIVGQLSVGAELRSGNEQTFDVVENFTQGECVTTFRIDRKFVGDTVHPRRGYFLEPVFELKEGQLMQLKKIRNLRMCVHKVPYFFGSVENFRGVREILSEVNSSNSHMVLSATEFVSGTSNVVTTTKLSEAMLTTLYENISLRLESIQPAENEPLEVRDPEPASMFIGRWLIGDSSSEES